MRRRVLLALSLFAVGACQRESLLPVAHAVDGGGDAPAPVVLNPTVTLPATDRLRFGVFGDARPPKSNDTAGYPTDVLTHIFTLMQSQGAAFAIGTGDYMFTNRADDADAQVALLLSAEMPFAAPVFHVLGNHECDTTTATNCPNADETPNIRTFMSKLLPSGVTTPYYRVDVDTPHGAAKLLMLAANAWTPTQADWLARQLADPTAYTFIVRHETPAEASTVEGVRASEGILQGATYSLELLGHYHEYKRLDTNHVISGNGGAPMTNPGNFGFLLIEQLDDGNLSVSEIDQATGNITDNWRVTPDGTAAE